MKYSPNKLKKILKNVNIKDDVEIVGYWVVNEDDLFSFEGDVIIELYPKSPQPGSLSWTINAGSILC